jgi:AraC-like DNA-binding protein
MFCGTNQGWFRAVFQFSNPRFNWLKVLNILLLLHTVILFTEVNLNLIFNWPQKWFEWATTIFLILISYVFLYGIINFPDIIHIDKKQIGLSSPKKYSKPNLTNRQSAELMQNINQYMEKYQPYRNPDFCMADFSESIGVSGHLISEVTNGLMKQNFFDYVNNYRVEEFKKMLSDPEKKNDKIMFLAYDAGFNSKTTFNTTFKKFTGQTPSEFRKSI